MLGLKFRRQHPIGNYFADFACVEAGLVIELDGDQHNEALATDHDYARSNEMASGLYTLRFIRVTKRGVKNPFETPGG